MGTYSHLCPIAQYIPYLWFLLSYKQNDGAKSVIRQLDHRQLQIE
jgi:hypothetical protein